MFTPNLNNIFDTKDMKCVVVSVEDSNVRNVVKKFADRAEHGFTKYGVTTAREDLSLLDWLNHLQDELMDATIYVERLKASIPDSAVW